MAALNRKKRSSRKLSNSPVCQKSPNQALDFFAYKKYNKDKGGEFDANPRDGKQKSDGILLRG